MNYLQLCQRLRQEAGISGTGPATVAGQIGEYKRVVDWVIDAWLDIQNEQDNWDFMWSEFGFDTTADTQDYAVGDSGIGHWDPGSFRIYKTAHGERAEYPLTFMDYETYRRKFEAGSWSSGTPSVIAALPNDTLRIGPGAPDAVYTVSGDYYAEAAEMAADTDTPSMPAKYHRVIVDRALMLYAQYEDAPEVYQGATANYGARMRTLLRDQIRIPGPDVIRVV